jgi:membrane protein
MRPIRFLIQLGKEAQRDDLFALASQLTYKLLLAFFPFLIFLISTLAFLSLDATQWIETLENILPGEAGNLLDVFFKEIVFTKNLGVLSISLLVSLYSSSSGFAVVMRCVNLTYEQKDCRNFFFTQLISIVLVLIFSLSLVSMLVLLIFNKLLFNFFAHLLPYPEVMEIIFESLGFLVDVVILIIAVMFIYKLANCKKQKLRSVLPGACVTVIIWIVASKAFSIYVNNFGNYSKVYGSIAGIFILIVWLNMISTTLLIGSEINSLLDENSSKKVEEKPQN